MLDSQSTLRRAGLDELALKPREVDLGSVGELPIDRVTIDYEGPAAVPSPATFARLADQAAIRVTVPVRADGFDPLGDDSRWADLPSSAAIALVAGNPAYLTEAECSRRIEPRLTAALERAPGAWVGTEGIEQLALETGAAQFELLGPDTEHRVRNLREAGFDGDVAVYAPTALADDEDAVLDAIGPYVARRRRVAAELPLDARTDACATEPARSVLLDGCADYAVAGDLDAVRERVDDLRAAGVDHVVCYPAGGLAEFRDPA